MLKKQNEVNDILYNISMKLKDISNIGMNYIEYISALIYVIYENKESFKRVLDIKPEKYNNYVLKKIDEGLYDIRIKENSMKLFSNINFSQIINIGNYSCFEEVVKKLINLIVNLEENEKNILAEAFEYIIIMAAKNNEIVLNSKEFYTPEDIIQCMVSLLEIKDSNAIYNPACGIGNFMVQAAKNANIYVFGEEKNISNYNICITNLWLHDISNKRINEYDEEKIQQVDLAIGNPPFIDEKKSDIFQGISNYTKYLYRMLENVHQYGKIAVILPHGFLFKKVKSEYKLRRRLVEENYIDAIIALPEKLFYETKIPVIILLINKNKKRKDILFIDASREYSSGRKNNILTKENQEKIISTYRNYEIIENYSYISNLSEIQRNDYDLNIKKYVKFNSEVESIDRQEIKNRILDLENEKENIQNEILNLIKNME